MWQAFYSGYASIVKIIFRCQFTLTPRTDLFIADTPNNRPFKTFLVEKCINFTSDNVLQFRLSFQYFLICFLASLMVIKMKIHRDFQLVFTFMADAFPSWKDVAKISHMTNHLSFTAIISTNHSNSVLSTASLVGTFTHCKRWLTSGLQII